MVRKQTSLKGGPASLRRVHRSMALQELLRTGGISRTGLADCIGLSQMAASRIIRDLIEAGLVVEAGAAAREAGPGRKQMLLEIREDGVYSAGILLSAYSNEVAIVSATGRLVASRTVAFERSNGQQTAELHAYELKAMIAELGIPLRRIAGVGISVAANVNPDAGRIVDAGYLGWQPFDLVGTVGEILKLPVSLENIVNAMTLAESSIGVAKSIADLVLVRCATTLGASILQHGRIVRGSGFRAGRIGHYRLKKTTLVCTCGRNDCLNCSASGWAILCNLKTVDDQKYDPSQISVYARHVDNIVRQAKDQSEGQEVARELRNAGGALAEALHLINQTVEPEAIVLTGYLPRAQSYLDGIRSRLSEIPGDRQETAAKIRLGEVSAVRAAAIMPLLSRVYAPTLDFEGLCASTGADIERESLASAG